MTKRRSPMRRRSNPRNLFGLQNEEDVGEFMEKINTVRIFYRTRNNPSNLIFGRIKLQIDPTLFLD